MRFCLLVILFTNLAVETLCAQDLSSLRTQAEKLHQSYQFEQAIALYKQILEQSADSLYQTEIQRQMILSENGKALLEFGCTPEVIATSSFPAADFFLHGSGLENGGWVPVPAELLGAHAHHAANTGFTPVMYFPKGAKKVVYSAPDNSGSWNIYMLQKLNDTLWSSPALLNENVTSVGNELFPLLSPDGKSLFFSSNGHYGMGGYDLYVSTWDEELNDWSLAQNLGFPFSSTANDFLFYNTPDGLTSVFASDRENKAGEITLYALKFENLPLKKNIAPEEAGKIALLKPAREQKPAHKETSAGNEPENSEYNLAVKRVRSLQQEIKAALNQQKQNRTLYNTLTNAEDLALLEKKIAEQETKSLSLQQDLTTAMQALQKIELDFLSKGVILSNSQEAPVNEVNEETAVKFAFADNRMGQRPALNVLPTEPEVDLSFKILDQAVIADLSELPKGLVYQIQLFVVANKASLKALKGLSPVFERKGPTGKYIYSAGIFHTYDEALKNINKVKKQGFPSAMITAYNEGKSMPLKNARALEQKEKESAVYQIIITGFETLPAEYVKIIRENTEKDIAKTVENGAIRYVVGPFGNKTESEVLKTALDKAGLSGVLLEKVER